MSGEIIFPNQMRLTRLLIICAFIFAGLLGSNSYGQGDKKLYRGQYHRGRKNPGISLRGISKNELITLYLTTGYATYYGDLCNGIQCFKFRPQVGGGVILRTNYLGKRLSLRADVRFFRLYSDDVYKARNLDFRSSNWEGLLLGQFELFPYEKMMRRRSFINPYVYAGFGFVTYDPWGKLPNGKWEQLRPVETEHVKYGNVAFAYTAGFGLKFRYSYKWNFMVEGGYRFTTTDYMDDVSQKKFPKQASFDGNSIDAYLSNKSGKGDSFQGQRGNPKNNDGYFIFSAGVTYTFTKNHKHKIKSNQHLLRKN